MATKSASKAPASKSSAKFIKKITVKEVAGTPEIKKIPDGEIVPLMRVAGFAQGVKEGESTYGTWKALLGEFSAVNLKTGEIFTSPTAIIPGALGEMLIQQVYAALHNDASSRLQFALEIGVQISPRDANKYEYTTQMIQEPNAENPAIKLLGLS